MTSRICRRGPTVALLLLLASVFLPLQSAAHPLGNFSINHYSALHLTQEAITLHYILDLAEIPTFQVIQDVGMVPTAEHPSVSSYLAQQGDALRQQIHLTLNHQPLMFHLVSSDILFSPGAGGLPTLKLGLIYRAPYQALERYRTYALHYRDDNFPHRAGWHEIIATADTGITVTQSSVPTTDRSRMLTDYPTDLLNSPPQILEATVMFHHASDTAVPVTTATVVASDGTQPHTMTLVTNQQTTPRNTLTELLTAPQRSVGALLFALLLATSLGALHALEPGHGKTVVAAYLVGTRGTVRQALYLGTVVTVTHTAGVYLLGVVTLYASHYIVPEQLYPWLSGVSGGTIACLGIYLLLRRSSGHFHGHSHPHGHIHAHGHHHHAHAHAPMQVHAHPHPHAPLAEHTYAFSYTSSQQHDHPAVASGAGHRHDHAPAATPAPLAEPHTGSHAPPQPTDKPVSGRELLTLGITGGIVPCPAALVVLLSAVAMHRIGFGLLLIVAFSAGLALVLIAVGLLMVYARQFMERFQSEGPFLTRWLPLTSAALVTLFGFGMMLQALVNAGIVQAYL